MDGDYTLSFARSARKELEKIPASTSARILERVAALPQNLGDYRVIYSIDDAARMIDVSIIRHRRDVYRSF